MTDLAGVVQLLKKEQGRLTKELQGISAALAAFGKAYGKQTGTRGRKHQLGNHPQKEYLLGRKLAGVLGEKLRRRSVSSGDFLLNFIQSDTDRWLFPTLANQSGNATLADTEFLRHLVLS